MKYQIYIDPSPEENSDTAFEKVKKYHEDVFKKLEHVGITFSYKKYFYISFIVLCINIQQSTVVVSCLH